MEDLLDIYQGVALMRGSRMKGTRCLEVVRRTSEADLRHAAVELCQAGILTCTRGDPGEPGATYALAWLPLDDPDQYPSEIRERNAANLARLLNSEDEVKK
jgi:hypothetical protein